MFIMHVNSCQNAAPSFDLLNDSLVSQSFQAGDTKDLFYYATPDEGGVVQELGPVKLKRIEAIVNPVKVQLSVDRDLVVGGETLNQIINTTPFVSTENIGVFEFKSATISSFENAVFQLSLESRLNEAEKTYVIEQIAELIMTEIDFRYQKANDHLPGHMVATFVQGLKDFVFNDLPEPIQKHFIWNTQEPIQEDSVLDKFVQLLQPFDIDPIMLTFETVTDSQTEKREIAPHTLDSKIKLATERFKEVQPLLNSCQYFLRPQMQMPEHNLTDLQARVEMVYLEPGTALTELDSFLFNYLMPMPQEDWAPFLDEIGNDIAACFRNTLKAHKGSPEVLRQMKIQFDALPPLVQYYVEINLTEQQAFYIKQGHY